MKVSDIFVYKVALDNDLLHLINPSRKKLDLKLEIVNLVLNHPKEMDMKDMLRLYPTSNNNQINVYLKEEGIRDLLPTKFGKIENRILTFVRENSGVYSTQEVIDILDLNRKTFYKVYNSHPEDKQHFRTMSRNCKNVKDLIDSSSTKLSIQEIASRLNISTVVVKNNITTLGYEDKVEVVESITEKVVSLIKESPNTYQITDLAEMLGENYNTIYKIVQRQDIQHLLA